MSSTRSAPSSSLLAAAAALSLLAASPAAPAAEPAPGRAETPPSVEQFVTEALAAQPSIAALRARLAAARELIAPAGALADPMVEAMYTEAGFPGWTVGRVEMSMVGVEVRQNLSRRAKREARAAVAEAEASARAVDVEALRRQVARDVRVLCARLYALDRQLETTTAGAELLDLLAETAASRYRVGEGDQEGLIKAQLERTRLEERRTDLAAERRAAEAALARLLDRGAGFRVAPFASLDRAPFPAGAWDELVEAGSAEIAARRAAVEVAEKRAAAAKLELKANYSAAAAAYYRGSFDPVVTLKFGVELPARRSKKQAPLLRAAELDLEAARRDLDAERAALREETARLAADKERAETQIERYREGILPQTSAAFEAARSAYLNGRGSFSTAIEDFNLWLDARGALARREGELFAAWAELEALTTAAPAAKTEGETR